MALLSQVTGVHVAVEGLDGSGKSTLIDGLTTHFEGHYEGRFEVRQFYLPDPAAFAGRDLRDVLAHEQPPPSPDVLALGFAANRMASYEQRIAPWLAERPDRIALSHRYVLSGLAYQSADGVSLAWLLTLNERVPPPDLTVFIDTKPEVCEERIRGRAKARELFETRFAMMRAAFLSAIDAVRDRGWRVVNVDGAAAPAELVETTATLVTSALPGR